MLEQLLENYNKSCQALADFFPGWEGPGGAYETVQLLDAKWARRETDNECWGQLGYADPPESKFEWMEHADLDMDQNYESIDGEFIVFFVVLDDGEYYVFRKSNEIKEG